MSENNFATNAWAKTIHDMAVACVNPDSPKREKAASVQWCSSTISQAPKKAIACRIGILPAW
eukprot:3538696-Amphidinium_carterae.1